MTDKGTMQDQIDDLMEINAKLHRHIDYLHAERDKWRKIADDFATTHRHRLGLDGAWDSVNLAYDRAVRGD